MQPPMRSGTPAMPRGLLRPRAHRAMAAALALISLCTAGIAVAANPADRFSRPIEAYPVYVGQEKCSPTVKEGTRKLAAWLMRTYPGTGSSGIVRACSAGGRSEHKEGRAFDWRVNYYNPRQRAQAEHFLRQLTATDRHGNKFALARRMGVMYAIWNNRIFSMSGPGWRAYHGPSPHRDHVHISLNWDGALGKSSFYSGKVTHPGSPLLRPAPGTKTSGPVPPVLHQQGNPPPVLHVTSRGAVRRSNFSLKAGRTYRLVATGLYRYGPDARQLADPLCAWSPEDDRGWAPAAQDSRPVGLTVNGSAGWRTRSGGICDPQHTYVWNYRPTVTGPMEVRLIDAAPADNRGKVTLHVLTSRADAGSVQPPGVPPLRATPSAPPEPLLDGWALVSERVTVPAADPAGVRTVGVLSAGVPYEIVARGIYQHGHGEADAECSNRTNAPAWHRDSSVHPRHPGADTLDLYVEGTDLISSAEGGDAPACDVARHTYRSRFVPTRTGRVTLAVWDPYPHDNTGELDVEIRRAAWPRSPAGGEKVTTGPPLIAEQLFVDAANPEGALTDGVLQRGVRYQITVTGRWSYGPGWGDAECSTAPGETTWRRSATEHGFGKDLFDLYFNGADVGLRPVGASVDDCSTSSTYTARYRPRSTARLRLALWALESRDAGGGLTVDIRRI